MQDSQEPKVLALVRDLMFTSRITATARSLSVEVRVIRDPASLANQPGKLLLVDLNLAGAIETASAWRNATGGAVIGFVSHVDAATISKARDQGLDRVIARSGFVEALPGILVASAGRPPGSPLE